MSTKVLLKKSSITGKAPVVGDLSYGELAINYADGVLYYRKSDDTIQQIGGTGGTAFTYDSSAPSTPNTGDVWVDSNSGIQYIYIDDGDSSQWVELGLSIAEGIIPGGTTGQVLTKSSNSDYETEWTTLDALPDQSGNNGKFLTTNGSAASWGTIPSSLSKTSTAHYWRQKRHRGGQKAKGDTKSKNEGLSCPQKREREAHQATAKDGDR